MGRILFFLLLAVAAYVVWKWLQRASTGRTTDQRRSSAAPAQAMVSCAHCGLHLPRSDALVAGDRYFCSDEHRRLGASV
ncbi:MAG TPA: PP0621 family protein [Burkholderiaceae bacterium]|nr:PP0621 family protein [Burkholderiaceae bacterium]